MAIELIREDERLTLTVFGAEIYYRRLPSNIASRMRKECERRGVVDDVLLGRKFMEYCLLGWNDQVMSGGQQVPFSFEAAMALPNEVIEKLIAEISAASGVNVAVDPTKTSGNTSSQ
jgi:hypothetical protein